MNADFINPFILGSQNVFLSICEETPSLGKPFVKNMPYTPSQVAVSISVIGDIQGLVVYNMKESTGCYIASKMMFGMPIETLDEMSQSAVAELANMISGNVATIFAGKGVKVDITPPQFMLNASPSDFPPLGATDKIICMPLHFSEGHVFEVDVLLQ